jgi:hypothetical protein
MNIVRRIFPGIANTIAQYRNLMFGRLFGPQPIVLPDVEEGQVLAPNRWRVPKWVHPLLMLGAAAFYGVLIVRLVRTWDVSALKDIQFWFPGIVLATGIQMVGYLGTIGLWGGLFRWFNYRLHFLQHLKIYAYSALANKLPGFFWSIATRVYLYNRYGVAKTTTAVNIGFELLSIGVASSLLSLVLLLSRPMPSSFLSPATIGISLALCLLCTHPRILRSLLARVPNPALLQALTIISWQQILLVISGYASIIVLGGICLFGIVSSVVGVRWDIFPLMLQTWALTLLWSTLLAWLPADFGLRQGPFLVMFSTVFPSPLVLVLLLVWRLWFNVMELFWGACGLITALFIEKHLSP